MTERSLGCLLDVCPEQLEEWRLGSLWFRTHCRRERFGGEKEKFHLNMLFGVHFGQGNGGFKFTVMSESAYSSREVRI